MNNILKIHEKINSLCPIDGVSMSDPIVFWPKSEATKEQINEAQKYLDNIDWEAEELEEAKKNKIIEIDEKTRSAISKGFIFDNHTFSLSANAQLNWAFMFSNANNTNYPFVVSTINDTSYSLKNKKTLIDFCDTAMNTVINRLAAGRLLKEQVNKLNTIEEINNFNY